MDPRVILVTGANRGLGLEVVRQCAAAGHRVILTARRPDDALSAAAEAGVACLPLDVTDEASLRAAVTIVGARWERLDVLVNNAAILEDRDVPADELDADTLRRTLDVNVVAVQSVIHAFLPLLRLSEDPRIVNVSSAAGQLGVPDILTWAPAYSVSKAALNSLTRQLAAALPGIAVNAVSPGWCRTRMGGDAATLSAAEGAAGITWLATEAPPSLTGQFLRAGEPIPW